MQARVDGFDLYFEADGFECGLQRFGFAFVLQFECAPAVDAAGHVDGGLDIHVPIDVRDDGLGGKADDAAAAG